MIVLLIIIVLPGFFDSETNNKIIWPINRTILLFSCLNIIQKMKKVMVLIALIGILGTSLDWVEQLSHANPLFELVGLFLFTLFVCIVTFEVFNQILKSKQVSFQTIIAAFDGFLLVGIVGTLMFSFIHFLHPGSFSNIAPGQKGIDDLLYYGYITLLTIGYGDIVPISQAAKRLSILMGLIGQFYLVIVMSVLVGKFLTDNRNKA